MKKIFSFIIVAALVLSLSACGGSSTEDETAESTEETQDSSDVLGKVTAIDGNTITIQEFSQLSMDEDKKQGDAPEMPSGDGDTGNAPEMPSGDGDTGSAPEKPSGDGEQGDAPEKPSGDGDTGSAPEMPSGDGNTGSAPEMPSGDADTGSVPEMPSGDKMQQGESRTITISDTSVLYKYENEAEVSASLDDITVGVMLKISYNDNSEITKIIIGSESDFGMGGQSGEKMSGGQPGGQGGSSDVVYGGASEITSAASESGKTYSSDTADESALLISTSEAVTISSPALTKTGDSDGGDNCNFYGQNAALLVKGGSTTTITGGTITSDAQGANGVFSYGGNGGQNGSGGDGTTVIISDTTITTTGDGSGGIMTTGGGITEASNLTVTTSGQSSAAIRTDRGGGTVTVDGGTYTSKGLGSPAIYSTADISVANATLDSQLSEGVCIEGLNSIELTDCSLTANNTKCNGNATFCDTIMIYQSMSGDAASGTSAFTMTGGTLTSKNGHVFHVTNTNAVITLNGVKIVNEDAEGILISVCDDGWSGGSNEATLNASGQELAGGVLVGDNSTLTMTLSNASAFTGYINGKINNADGKSVSTEVGTVAVTLDGTSSWTLTADSYVTSFTGDASNIISNGYTLYVNGVALTGTK